MILKRIFFTFAGAAFVGAALLAYMGFLRGAISALCVAAGAVLLATWARPSAFPGRQWIALALVFGGLVVATQSLLVGGVFVALVVLQLAVRLVTINSGMARMPADVLRQEVDEGSPSDLLRAHEAALELLADRGLVPTRFRDDAEALESARELDLRALRAFADSPLTSLLRIEVRRRVGDPVLAEDDRSRRRIQAWLGTEPV